MKKCQSSRNIAKFLVFTLISITTPLCYAQTIIYKSVSQGGRVTYSDIPTEGSIAVSLNSSITTLPALTQKTGVPRPTAKTNEIQYSLDISPADEATIRNNLGEFDIRANLTPKRLSGIYLITINDRQQTSTTGIFNFSEMDRGEYQYNVKFIDNTGKVLASTQTRKLFLHKASRLINNAGK